MSLRAFANLFRGQAADPTERRVVADAIASPNADVIAIEPMPRANLTVFAPEASQFLDREAVTLPLLISLLRAAYVEFEVRDADRLIVQTDAGVKVSMSIHEGVPAIHFGAAYCLREDSPPEQQVAFAHRLNDRIAVARFAVPQPGTLLADYYLLSGAGLSVAQVMGALRLFSRVVATQMLRYDEERLMV